MTAHLPVLIVVIPLMTAAMIPLVARLSTRAARALSIIAYVAIFGCAVSALLRVLDGSPWHYHLGGWPPPWGIEYVIDPLSGTMAVLVSFVALLVFVYADAQRRQRPGSRTGLFDGLFMLLVAGLLGIIVTGDMFNLYVFLEISSLAAYGLLSAGGVRAVVATFRYLLLGTIAGSFYLLGTGYLYALTGTLNMADLTAQLPTMVGTAPYGVGVTLIVIGLAIKMAVFPLHAWQPDAYAYAPPPVTGFIAAVMSKVSAYALFRILFFVLRKEGAAGEVIELMGWVAIVAAVAGSVMAVAQTDVRRMLAYSSVSQMGYILFGLALDNAHALTGALLLIINHAVMKGCLFLAIGSVVWRTRSVTIDDLAGVSRRLPLTMAAFTIAAISMVGLPPTAGFFSKWYLVQGAIEKGAWVFLAALIFSSLLSAVYFFRVIERAYFCPPPDEGVRRARLFEVPLGMLVPVIGFGVAVLLLGFFNHLIVSRVLQAALPVL